MCQTNGVHRMRGRLIVLHIGKIPQIEECGARYVHHLVVVYAQSLVARFVIIGMTVCVIPYNRYVLTCERHIVAASDRLVRRSVIGNETQSVLGDVVLEPLAEHRFRVRIEVNHILRNVRFVVTSYHVEVEITLYFVEERTRTDKISRAVQSQFLTVPESENHVALRLYACEGHERLYLRHVHDAAQVRQVREHGEVLRDGHPEARRELLR